MAEPTLATRPALTGAITAAGLRIAPVDNLIWAAIALRRGRHTDLVARLQGSFSLATPAGPGASFAGPATLLWAGADRLTLLQDGPAVADVAQAVGDAGDVTDLTGSQATVMITGPAARAVLGRLVAIDLHPKVFHPGSAAATLCGHFGVTLWQTDDAPTYRMSAYRSFAGALWHALETAARGV